MSFGSSARSWRALEASYWNPAGSRFYSQALWAVFVTALVWIIDSYGLHLTKVVFLLEISYSANFLSWNETEAGRISGRSSTTSESAYCSTLRWCWENREISWRVLISFYHQCRTDVNFMSSATPGSTPKSKLSNILSSIDGFLFLNLLIIINNVNFSCSDFSSVRINLPAAQRSAHRLGVKNRSDCLG